MNIVYLLIGLVVLGLALEFGAVGYLALGWFKCFYHDILDWHTPDENVSQTFDGCSVHCKCKYCGKDIMQDSQGNWF